MVEVQSKEEKIKKRYADIAVVEEFMQTPYYQEFFGRLMDSLIEKYTNWILNEEKPEAFQPKYTENMIYARIRKELIAIKNNPAKRLAEMNLNLDTLLKHT